MERIRDWQELRELLRQKAGDSALKELDDFLQQGKTVHAIRLLRSYGIEFQD